MNDVIAYIGDRNVGKTTILFDKYTESINNGKRVLVIDSATEHVEKSLLVKIHNLNKGSILIPQCAKNQIVFPNVCQYTYPAEMRKEGTSVYLCDVSYYLEKGYDYPAGQQREDCRKMYKYFAMQVIAILMEQIDVFILDEIELLPEFRELIVQITNKKNIFMSLHKCEGLGGLNDLFHIERIT